jgi:hypothetical protein
LTVSFLCLTHGQDESPSRPPPARRHAESDSLDLEELFEDAGSTLRGLRALLPPVKLELWFLHLGRASWRLTSLRLERYLDVLEGQLESLGGAVQALKDIPPNDTQEAFIASLRDPLRALITECIRVSAGEGQWENVMVMAQRRRLSYQVSRLMVDSLTPTLTLGGHFCEPISLPDACL